VNHPIDRSEAHSRPAHSDYAGAVVHGREMGAPFQAKVDAVVVGSGAGGAVVARELAREGRSVLIIEEGGHYSPEEYGAMSPSHSIRRLAREAGLSAAVGIGDTPLISVLAGKCVGGSSVLTGGVCFRIPDDVLYEWAHELSLPEMTPEALDPYFTEVERTIHVETVPVHMRSRSTQLFVEGADKLGIVMKSLRRNTSGCHGAARCNFGCPHGAKMSVDLSFLPDAFGSGAKLVSDALVERIDFAGNRAVGVRGRLLDAETGEPRVPFEVRAKVVVVACGALHTPVLLRRSGMDTKGIGKHLTLHPAFRVSALFDEEVNGWDGSLQSVYSDQFQSDGITLVGVYSALNVLAAAFPGVGKQHRRLVEQMKNLAVFGGMVHDDGGGRVHRWISREPLITYRMIERDRRRLFKGIQILGRMAFAAGAREVMLPLFGFPTFKKESELAFLTEQPPGANRVECMAFHPLGSAKMSVTPGGGVVKPTGEAWSADNLFLADGSVLPTSIGVNSQLPVMAVAMKIARGLCDDWATYARRADF
jgi:choline dehydrogenase-like flavoprotein